MPRPCSAEPSGRSSSSRNTEANPRPSSSTSITTASASARARNTSDVGPPAERRGGGGEGVGPLEVALRGVEGAGGEENGRVGAPGGDGCALVVPAPGPAEGEAGRGVPPNLAGGGPDGGGWGAPARHAQRP